MQYLFIAVAVLMFMPQVSSGTALLTGIAYSLILGNPYPNETKKWTSPVLQWSVIGLGAGMNLATVAKVGLEGFEYTIVGISATMLVGILIGRWLKIKNETSVLVTSGTAICGGSAIAAVSAAIGADATETSVALATVFLLNSVALFLFPWLGHRLQMSETQFGIFSALGIHDTSSVVGATLQYGSHALEVGTTIKLARALWIVPLTLIIGWFWKGKPKGTTKAKKPWFILGFLIAASLVTWVPALQTPGKIVVEFAKRTLVFTLFLIGSGLTKSTLQKVGLRPFIQGILLWLFAGLVSYIIAK